MATANVTRTVTVNAAFLREIKEVHRELWQLLKEVQQMHGEPLHDSKSRQLLLAALERLRDQVALQFALEEAYGYFDDPADVAQQVCRDATALRAEHRRLYVHLCDLAEDAQTWHRQGEWPLFRSQFAAQFAAFHNRFQLHESREMELIERQFSDGPDLGD